MNILLLLTVLALPNPTLTPGSVRPLSKQQICAITWHRDVRHVSVKMKQEVFANYGIPWADRAQYEVDHAIPRSMGGADAVVNLWPQPLVEARQLKDPLEARLSRLICDPASGVRLATARRAIRGDWKVAYLRYMGKNPMLKGP